MRFAGPLVIYRLMSSSCQLLMLIDRRSAGLMLRLVYCGSATGLMVMLIDFVVYGFVEIDVDFN